MECYSIFISVLFLFTVWKYSWKCKNISKEIDFMKDACSKLNTENKYLTDKSDNLKGRLENETRCHFLAREYIESKRDVMVDRLKEKLSEKEYKRKK